VPSWHRIIATRRKFVSFFHAHYYKKTSDMEYSKSFVARNECPAIHGSSQRAKGIAVDGEAMRSRKV
jgi:hypothetical protein